MDQVKCFDEVEGRFWATPKPGIPYVEGIADPPKDFTTKLKELYAKKDEVNAAHVHMTKGAFVRYCTMDSGPYVSYICGVETTYPKEVIRHLEKVDHESPLTHEAQK
ncbi:unnamed protein product [Aphanomyces euteiches]